MSFADTSGDESRNGCLLSAMSCTFTWPTAQEGFSIYGCHDILNAFVVPL
jgi:hypothetical protein